MHSSLTSQQSLSCSGKTHEMTSLHSQDGMSILLWNLIMHQHTNAQWPLKCSFNIFFLHLPNSSFKVIYSAQLYIFLLSNQFLTQCSSRNTFKTTLGYIQFNATQNHQQMYKQSWCVLAGLSDDFMLFDRTAMAFFAIQILKIQTCRSSGIVLPTARGRSRTCSHRSVIWNGMTHSFWLMFSFSGLFLIIYRFDFSPFNWPLVQWDKSLRMLATVETQQEKKHLSAQTASLTSER